MRNNPEILVSIRRVPAVNSANPSTKAPNVAAPDTPSPSSIAAQFGEDLLDTVHAARDILATDGVSKSEVTLAGFAEGGTGTTKDPSLEQGHCNLFTIHTWHIDLREDVERACWNVTRYPWHSVQSSTNQISALLEFITHLLRLVRGLFQGLEHSVLHRIIATRCNIILHLGDMTHRFEVR